MKGFRYFRTIVLLTCVTLTGCAGIGQRTDGPKALPFEKAIRIMANELLIQAVADYGPVPAGTRVSILFDPFVDADSRDVPRVSSRIESLFMEEAKGHRTNGIDVAHLRPETQAGATYLVQGLIKLNRSESGGGTLYRVSGTVTDLRDQRVVGRSNVWISDPNLDYGSLAIYQDNPFFNPVYMEGRTEAGTSVSGPPRGESYRLGTLALLREASAAYESQDYDNALALFQQAAKAPDGQTLWCYAGLYLTLQKLGRLDEADAAFSRIIAVSVEQNRTITVRFLFKVNSVAFWEDKTLNERYRSWLRHIGDYFKNTDLCLHIVGHSSKTGPESWNERLSLMRARRIQRMLAESFPEAMTRTRAIGKGSKENVVGIGTDDERDALDRRVEFVIVSCPVSEN